MVLSFKAFKKIHRRVGRIGLIIAFLFMPVSAQESAPDGIKFEIVSVKVLSDKEAAKRLPDAIGPDLAVRLRLSTSDRGCTLLGYRDSFLLYTYRVKMTERGISWWYEGKPVAQSPGIRQIITNEGMLQWFVLPSHSAIEWEMMDMTKEAGEEHAYTIFMKRGGEPFEVISESYKVPSKKPRTMPASE